MYKRTLIPDEKNHSIDLPEEFYGKKVVVVVTEIESEQQKKAPLPPLQKKFHWMSYLKHLVPIQIFLPSKKSGQKRGLQNGNY